MSDLGQRLKALRKARRITQDELSTAAQLDRVAVVHIETGRNQASSYAVREALARGLNLPIERLAAYLDGKIQLEQILTETSKVTDPRSAAAALAREDGVQEAAIQSVLAEPLPEPPRSTLWWALRMRVREGELAARPAEAQPPKEAAGKKPGAPGRVR